ncbi:GDSL lipase [Mycobacterium sp.]|uniref:Rv0518 family GDSL lipase n=1 Tax=Mycobacterium sp. TaxID=1785 RepID=UPI0025ED33FE|nr:GDSL lipase [Mycobacterium sp.]
MSRLGTVVMTLAVLLAALGHRADPTRNYTTLSVGSPANHLAVIGDSYTTGTREGGRGPQSWTSRAWATLERQGVQVAPDVAAEGRAGYGVPGDHGSVFGDLAAKAVHSDDVLVVFFGSRNDQGTDPDLLAEKAHDAFDLVRRAAPSARLLVIGPPWPTADAPADVLRVRDVIADQSRAAGATFVDPIAENWFVGRSDLIGADGVHPNDAGHAYMAAKIVPLIRAQLPWLV